MVPTTAAAGPVTVLCGNPRPGSRTLETALRAADALAADPAAPDGAALALARPGPRVVDLAHWVWAAVGSRQAVPV